MTFKDLKRFLEKNDVVNNNSDNNSRDVDNGYNGNSNGNSDNIEYWKGKKVIPLSEWKKIADHV